MTSNSFQLSQTADRITSAIALLVAAVIAAPIVLLAIAPFRNKHTFTNYDLTVLKVSKEITTVSTTIRLSSVR